jgi:hypothetical protein
MNTKRPTLLVITGPPGVGKTTVAGACADLLAERGMPCAYVDMDMLRWCYPAPPDDPFHMRLGLRNLAAVWANCRAAGAERLLLADIVEQRSDVAGYEAAVPGARLSVVRLRAPIAAIHDRLAGREQGPSLAWHQARAIELQERWEQVPVEDFVVDTEGREASMIAHLVLTRAGWL